MTELIDYAGCSHVHTRYSDGSYRYEEILPMAREADLDFVVMTDHDDLRALRDGWPGWHDGLLCIVGVEVSARGGHIVAAGIDDCAGLKGLPVHQSLERIAAQGGTAFAAHPLGKSKRLFNVHLGAWSAWDSPLFAGIELWCYMHDWIHELHLGNFRRFYRDPDAQITGPEPELLRRWDQATQERRLSALGALDNHARNLPFHRVPHPLWTILPHDYVFRTVRTHLLVEQLHGEAADDVPAVLAALARGSGYLSYDLLADPRGFDLIGRRGTATIRMGDEVVAGEPLLFELRAPIPCELRVIRNGQQVAREDGCRASYTLPAGQAGVIRAETRLHGRPWIFSNPIYVRQAPGEPGS